MVGAQFLITGSMFVSLVSNWFRTKTEDEVWTSHLVLS